MSREERRQYQRMMKGAERTAVPPLSPAARAKLERSRARREKGRAKRSHEFTLRFWIVALVVAFLVGLLALSLAWPNGNPFALVVGLLVGAATLAVQVAIRWMQRRRAGG